MVAAAVVGTVGAIGSAVVGSNAAGAASRAQTNANNEAIATQQQNQQASDAALNQQQQQTQANLAPYLATGTSANNELGYLLGTGGSDSSGGVDGAAGSLAQSFNPTDFQGDPGYQFALQQGDAALNRASASQGKYFSGAAIKGLSDYNQGLATTDYQNAYNNYNTNQNNLYTKLSGVSLSGQNAANSIASNSLGTQQDVAAVNQNATNAVSGTQQTTGNDQASADLAQARSWQTGLTSAGNNAFALQGVGAGFQQGLNGAGVGYGTQGTTVQGMPWLTSNV